MRPRRCGSRLLPIPLLAIADIAAIVDLAHSAGALVVVDNTFATPYLQQPLELGADVVVHSTTKYCGGHSDIIGGALVLNDDDLAEQLRFHQNAIGGVASPFDCWLVLRGLRTLAVRMERHCDNAELVAAFLDDHPRIAQVYFPGLDAHPGHDLAKRQMRRYGGMVSFRVVGGEQAALQVCEGTSVIILGESLGGVESLIEHPGKMTHASVAGTQLEVPGDLIRLSVGIEDAEDLIADLDKASRLPWNRAVRPSPHSSRTNTCLALAVQQLRDAKLRGLSSAQSTGSPPVRTSRSLARLKGRDPKNPAAADNGEGWALAR